MKKKHTYILIILALFASCQKETDNINKFELNDTIKIPVGQTFVNTSNKLNITFDSVLNDSRCPILAYCFWEGNATSEFKVDINGSVNSFELDTYNSGLYSSDTVISSYTFKLLMLEPYPEIGVQIANSDYVAHIIISK